VQLEIQPRQADDGQAAGLFESEVVQDSEGEEWWSGGSKIHDVYGHREGVVSTQMVGDNLNALMAW